MLNVLYINSKAICINFVGYVKAREAIAAEHSFPLSPITYKVILLYMLE